MLRRTIIAFMIMGLGVVPVAVRAAENPVTPMVESAKETVQGAANTAATEFSDSWITMQTKIALLADERVSSRDVSVKTEKGVITLRGKVESEQARQAADEIALKIEGAKQVTNRLVVVSKATRKAVNRKDDQIVKDVEKRLKADPSLKKADIDVRADMGIVTLTGKVPSLATSVRASEAAYRVGGVRAVRNELTLERKG